MKFLGDFMYALASTTLIFSVLSRIVAAATGDFEVNLMSQLPGLALYLMLSFILLKRLRWAAWLGFFLMLLGVLVALSGVNSGDSANWAYYLIALFDFLTAACLFCILWRNKDALAVT